MSSDQYHHIYRALDEEAIKYVEEGAKSIQIYHVAMDALDEAAKKVAVARNKMKEATTRATFSNGDTCGSQETLEIETAVHQGEDEKEKTIRDLTAELERTNQRCEVYRANLMSILRDMEEEKFELSLKVQHARLSLRE